MKKLLATILSLCLILTPVSAVHASDNKEKGNAFAKQILAISSGIIGGTILLKCKLGSTQPSLYAYMAGGLTFIAGELRAGYKQKKNQEASLARAAAAGVDPQALQQAQVDDLKSTIEVVELRKKWMAALHVIYGIATALAVVEIWLSFAPPVGISKTDYAACTPDPSHNLVTTLFILAYTSLLSASGNVSSESGFWTNFLASGAAQALLLFVPKIKIGAEVGDKAVAILSSAWGRVPAFAVSAGLILWNDLHLADVKKKTSEDLKDSEAVLAQYEDAGNNGLANNLGSYNLIDLPKANAVKSLPKSSDFPKHCYSNTPNGPTYSEAGCKNPMKLVRPKFGLEMNIPGLVAGANAAADMAQAVADGDMAAADMAASSLASMAGRIDKIKSDLMKKLNDKLKAEGKRPIDVDGELQRQIAALNQGLNQANPGSGNINMADIKPGEAGISETKKAPSAAEITTAKSPEGAPVAPGLDLSGIGQGSNEDDQNANANVATLSDSLSEFEASEADIAKDPGVSIFKQVSHRYFLNYTKIFKRKEITPVPGPQPAP